MVKTIILSPFFDQNVQLVAGMCHKCYQEKDDCYIVRVNTSFLRQVIRSRKNQWIPPRSPHNLIEESLYDNPWGLLAATIFLNRTSCFCAKPSIDRFLQDYPTPESVIEKKPEDLEVYFDDLGLQKIRSLRMWRMSHDFVHKKWRNVGELYGIGRYGEDAFRMFCLADFSVEPQDRFLRIYRAWYLEREEERRKKHWSTLSLSPKMSKKCSTNVTKKTTVVTK